MYSVYSAKTETLCMVKPDKLDYCYYNYVTLSENIFVGRTVKLYRKFHIEC